MDDQPVEYDVVIVGAGPAGMSAALELERIGVNTAILDSKFAPGGQYYQYPMPFVLPVKPVDDDGLLVQFLESSTDYYSGSSVWGIFKENDKYLICVDGEERFRRLLAKKVILATGSYERSRPFPGWTLPGVLTAGAALKLAKSNQSFPADEVVLCGKGPQLFSLANALRENNIRVFAILQESQISLYKLIENLTILLHPGRLLKGLQDLFWIFRGKIPVYWNWEIESISGMDQAESVCFRNIRRPGIEKSFPVKMICLSYGFLASNELAWQAGCQYSSTKKDGIPLPVLGDNLESSLPGFFVAGDSAGAAGKDAAVLAGKLAAVSAAGQLGRVINNKLELQYQRDLASARKFWRLLSAMFSSKEDDWWQGIPDDTILCRCEEITYKEIHDAVLQGATSVTAIKQITRTGMGRCQGRQCSFLINRFAARLSGKTHLEVGYLNPQAPVFPVRIGNMGDYSDFPGKEGYDAPC